LTAEGAIALGLALTPGLIRRGGMAGAATGLDYATALSLAPQGCDREELIFHLRCAEAGMLAGFRKIAKE
jgi:hypothetical protein